MVKRAPPWAANSEWPALSPRKAMRAAEAFADAIIGRRVGFSRKLSSLSLLAVEGGWVWHVRFEWYPTEGMMEGLPDALDVFVLMDGKVVQPKLTSWGKKREGAAKAAIGRKRGHD